MRQCRRLLCNDGFTNRHLFCIRRFNADIADAKHFITDLEILDAFSQRAHHPREIAPRAVGQEPHRTIAASDHAPVGTVDTRRMYIDQHLSRASNRLLVFAVLQFFGAAMFGKKCCFHRYSPVGCFCVAES